MINQSDSNAPKPAGADLTSGFSTSSANNPEYTQTPPELRIGVIEDSALMQAFWEKCMSELGVNHLILSSKSEDLSSIEEFKPDVLYCPGVPKYLTVKELAEFVHANTALQDTSVFVHTTLSDSRLHKEWDPNIVDGVLTKPFTKKQLARSLDQAKSVHVRAARQTPLAVIVDDSATARTVFSAEVRRLGFDAVGAVDAEQGYEMVCNLLPDLIIIDVELPGRNGYELCAQLAENPKTYQIPVLVVSSFVTEDEIRRGFNSGAIDFLAKPVDSNILTRAVQSILATAPKHVKGSVIVLEDDDIIAGLMIKILRKIGLEGYRCTNIAEMENHLTMLIPDMMTLDLSLPDGNSLDLCKRLRKRPELEGMPIMIVTGDSHTEILIECLRSGANDFLQKPFNLEEFTVRVENQIRTKRLIDDLAEKTRTLEGMAFNDGLTGLLNRRYLDAGLKREIERAEKSENCVSLMMLDLDHFKYVNDEYGHSAGDSILQEVAAIVKRTIRPIDIACRYGGEELCVLLPTTCLPEAMSMAEKIRRSVESQVFTDHRINQTISIGVSSFPNPSDKDTILENADDALYLSKSSGRNKVTAYRKAEVLN